jgi:hypothetical protein
MPHDAGTEPGLFQDLAGGAVGRRLARVLLALGQRPVVVSGTVDDDHLGMVDAFAADDQTAGGTDQLVGDVGAHRRGREEEESDDGLSAGASAWVMSIDTAPHTEQVWRVMPPPI